MVIEFVSQNKGYGDLMDILVIGGGYVSWMYRLPWLSTSLPLRSRVQIDGNMLVSPKREKAADNNERQNRKG